MGCLPLPFSEQDRGLSSDRGLGQQMVLGQTGRGNGQKFGMSGTAFHKIDTARVDGVLGVVGRLGKLCFPQIPESEANLLAGESGEPLDIEHRHAGVLIIDGALAVEEAENCDAEVLLTLQARKKFAGAQAEARPGGHLGEFIVVTGPLMGIGQNSPCLVDAEEGVGIRGLGVIGVKSFCQGGVDAGD